jgi:indole-3-acetate monooxygenase
MTDLSAPADPHQREENSGVIHTRPSGLAVIKTLATIEGSVGWTVMIANGGSLFASLLPHATYARLYREGPDVIFAGSNPTCGDS